MRELTDAEMDMVCGGTPAQNFPKWGINNAWDHQGYPDPDAKVLNSVTSPGGGVINGINQSGIDPVGNGTRTAANAPGHT